MKMFRIKNLPTKQQYYHLLRERPPVDEIPVEQIPVCFAGVAVYVENVEKVVKLPVDVPAGGEF